LNTAERVNVIIIVLITHDLSVFFEDEGLNFTFCFRGMSSFNLNITPENKM